MARNKTASLTAGAAARESRMRGGNPIFIAEPTPEAQPQDVHAFRSGTPITSHVFDAAPELAALEHKYRDVRRRARRRQVRRFRRLHPKTMATLPSGILSVSLYALLFANGNRVLAMSVNHWWSFLVPTSIALVFSLVHGSFTAAFWEAVGLRPNTIRR
ncbi:MAG: hypothetical protein MI741_19195 [Rhodospirillales bacterium]|nr:hypothetical protein [Rhodospirillales bacterium]